MKDTCNAKLRKAIDLLGSNPSDAITAIQKIKEEETVNWIGPSYDYLYNISALSKILYFCPDIEDIGVRKRALNLVLDIHQSFSSTEEKMKAWTELGPWKGATTFTQLVECLRLLNDVGYAEHVLSEIVNDFDTFEPWIRGDQRPAILVFLYGINIPEHGEFSDDMLELIAKKYKKSGNLTISMRSDDRWIDSIIPFLQRKIDPKKEQHQNILYNLWRGKRSCLKEVMDGKEVYLGEKYIPAEVKQKLENVFSWIETSCRKSEAGLWFEKEFNKHHETRRQPKVREPGITNTVKSFV